MDKETCVREIKAAWPNVSALLVTSLPQMMFEMVTKGLREKTNGADFNPMIYEKECECEWWCLVLTFGFFFI